MAKKIAVTRLEKTDHTFYNRKAFNLAISNLKEAVLDTNYMSVKAYAYERGGYIRITEKFYKICPLDQVVILIHEFIHAYQEFDDKTVQSHGIKFIKLLRSALKECGYPEVLGRGYQTSLAGGVIYKSRNVYLEEMGCYWSNKRNRYITDTIFNLLANITKDTELPKENKNLTRIPYL